MKIDGQSSIWYDFFGQTSGKEAKVTREEDSFFGKGIFNNDRIVLDAGDGDDEISVKKTGDDEYTVTVNGEKYQFTAEEMSKLTIEGGDGNDKIKIDRSVDVGITVDGGAGNDQIANRADNCEIYGGAGDDEIYSRGRNNYVDGGFRSIWDLLTSGDGGPGNDRVVINDT